MYDGYIDEICKVCTEKGAKIAPHKISVPGGYRDGAVVAPLSFEPDEFCGVWFVQFGLAVNHRFLVRRLDVGQARFRFSDEGDVQYPEAITKNEAEVKRDELIATLDKRLGRDSVNIAASTPAEAVQIWQGLWPLQHLR